MNTVTLSGWGQPHDALAAIAPNALHIDYARHHSVQAALLDIAAQAKNCDALIGWSLGGQLAVRAIISGLIKPRRLVLIASAFQFVAERPGELGMERFTYDKFRDNYARSPERTLAKAWELIAVDDIHAGRVKAHLNAQNKAEVLAKDWLHWLTSLDGFTFEGSDFSRLPPTLLFHGENDVVVESAQSERFAEVIPDAKLMIFSACGHAPHWHDTDAVKQAIKGHFDV